MFEKDQNEWIRVYLVKANRMGEQFRYHPDREQGIYNPIPTLIESIQRSGRDCPKIITDRLVSLAPVDELKHALSRDLLDRRGIRALQEIFHETNSVYMGNSLVERILFAAQE